MMTEINRQSIADAALSWLGTPYQHQASLKHIGCDCLGLVRGVWREVLGSEPQTTPAYSRDIGEITGAEILTTAAERWFVTASELKRGCVLLFRWNPTLPAKHLGMLVKAQHGEIPAQFIHAHEGQGVVIAPFNKAWQRRFVAAFDFPGLAPDSPPNLA